MNVRNFLASNAHGMIVRHAIRLEPCRIVPDPNLRGLTDPRESLQVQIHRVQGNLREPLPHLPMHGLRGRVDVACLEDLEDPQTLGGNSQAGIPQSGRQRVDRTLPGDSLFESCHG